VKDKSSKTFCGFFYFVVFLLLALCSLLFAGCSLPRIIVLEDPLSPEEHLNLGVAYEKKGEWESAIKEYEAASKRLPVAYTYLGNVYFQKNEFQVAEEYYRKAIKKDPENADAYNNLAWLYFTKKEQLEEAEQLALKAMELNPSKKNIYQDTLDQIKAARTHPLK
jgi:tetratricopeptide (TPR) repeat protein